MIKSIVNNVGVSKMNTFRIFGFIITIAVLSACTTTGKSYENQVFPKGKRQPVNTQNQAGVWQ